MSTPEPPPYRALPHAAAPCRSDPAVRSPACSPALAGVSYSYISSNPERRVLSALHMQVVLCCVGPSIHPSKQKHGYKTSSARNQTTTTKKKRHTQGTHASISPLDAQMPCFAVLVVEPASPRSIHPKPATNGPPQLISSQDRRNQSPYATHPSIHRTSSLLLCLLPIYHRPPCEPAEETKTPKKN